MNSFRNGILLGTFLAFSLNSVSVMAGIIPVLSPSAIARTIGSYPSYGSVGEASDDKILLDFQATRTPEECTSAGVQDNGSLRTFFGGPTGPLTDAEVKSLESRFLKAHAVLALNVEIAKRIYKRQRPYNRNKAIIPCIPLESSYSYPSGHTTMSRLYARILSKIYPKRAEAFMKAADLAARNRVLGGVHHPTDIEAGKKLGDKLAKSFF
jgi:acid phosphatase (class A)